LNGTLNTISCALCQRQLEDRPPHSRCSTAFRSTAGFTSSAGRSGVKGAPFLAALRYSRHCVMAEPPLTPPLMAGAPPDDESRRPKGGRRGRDHRLRSPLLSRGVGRDPERRLVRRSRRVGLSEGGGPLASTACLSRTRRVSTKGTRIVTSSSAMSAITSVQPTRRKRHRRSRGFTKHSSPRWWRTGEWTDDHEESEPHLGSDRRGRDSRNRVSMEPGAGSVVNSQKPQGPCHQCPFCCAYTELCV
jgi:hypothetical protein